MEEPPPFEAELLWFVAFDLLASIFGVLVLPDDLENSVVDGVAEEEVEAEAAAFFLL